MNKRLNVRLLIVVGVVVVVAGTAVHVLYGFQVRRHADQFREAGFRAADEKDLEGSAFHLERYLALRPDDAEARAKYALVASRLAKTTPERRRAYHLLEKAVHGQPDNVELRQALGHLAVQLRRFADAAHHLAPLRRAEVDLAELEQALAWCHLGAGDRPRAIECLRAATEHAPGRAVNYVQLAGLLLEAKQADEARQVMDRLVERNKQSAGAYVERARFRRDAGRLDKAAEDLDRARSLAPRDAGLAAESAELARDRNRLDEARRLLRDALAASPGDARLVLALAGLEHDVGRTADAVAVLRQGLKGAKEPSPDLVALLVELQRERGEDAEADREAARLGKANAALVSYAEACREMRRGAWVEAARRLEGLRPAVADLPSWRPRVELALARCYGACGDAARQAEACRQAVTLGPASRSARLALARALVEAGSLREACDEWAKLMKLAEAPAAGFLEWGRARARWNAQRDASRSDWLEAERVLAKAEQAGADAVALALIRAEALVARKEFGPADAHLREAAARHPDRGELSAAIAELASRRGDHASAFQTLSEARGRPGIKGDVELRLAQVRCARAAGSSQPGSAAAVEEAARGLERLAPADQGRVLRALAEAAWARGDVKEAARLCGRWARAVPHDLSAHLMQFDLANEGGDGTAAGKALEAVRHVEGDDGVRWRCGEATRLLAAARRSPQQDHRDALEEARGLLFEAGRRQPSWGRVALLTASVDEAEGRTDAALEGYLRAFDRGERHEGLVERLVQLLSERKKFVDANRVLRTYQEDSALAAGASPFAPPAGRAPLKLSLARLGSEVARQAGDSARAVELAVQAVPPDARDHRDHLWLADLLERAGRTPEARQVLERLVEHAGDIPDTWVALIRHLARMGERERAEDALARAQKRLGREPGQQYAGLAECHEALGKAEQAERLLRLVLAEAPADPLLLRRAARFYLEHDRPGEAAEHLRDLIDSAAALPEQTAWGRRMLATLPFRSAALGRSFQDRPPTEAEALRLLEENRQGGEERVDDRRARALVLGVNPQRRKEAVSLFEGTVRQRPLTPDEQLGLAQLHDLAGDRHRASDLMQALLASHGHNAQYLAAQVRRLLKQGDRAGARLWLERLKKVEPDTPRTRSLADAFLTG